MTSRSLTRKKFSCRVRPGVLLVRARARRPSSAFSRDDLPTFDRPATATSGRFGGGPPPGAAAAPRNRAAVTFTDASGSAPGRRRRRRSLVEPEGLVHHLHLAHVGLLQCALLQRLDRQAALVLAGLGERDHGGLAAVGGLELVL